MKDRLSFSDRTSFSRFSQRFSTACMSDGITGVELLSFASAILNHKMQSNIIYCMTIRTNCSRPFFKRKNHHILA
jgi:hypothetical protein